MTVTDDSAANGQALHNLSRDVYYWKQRAERAEAAEAMLRQELDRASTAVEALAVLRDALQWLSGPVQQLAHELHRRTPTIDTAP